jgi:hypothetical protein
LTVVDVTKLQQLQAELEQHLDRCERRLLRVDELGRLLRSIDERLEGALPPESDAFRVYDRQRREHTDWGSANISGYVEKIDCDNIAPRIRTIRKILEMVAPEFLREDSAQIQYYFPPGDSFRARQRFFQVLGRAGSDLVICDPYLDVTVLDFIELLDQRIGVRLLAGTPSQLFRSQFNLLKVMRHRLDARSTASSHDRWIVLDGREVWHLGASINGLGKKAFMMSIVADPAEAAKVSGDVTAWWTAGSPV